MRFKSQQLVRRLFIPGLLFCSIFTSGSFIPKSHAQNVVDKMVATVNSGVQSECGQICLVTLSDLLWQIALEPDSPVDNPSSDLLNRTLQRVIDQRLILQEAQKLPTIDPTREEIAQARDDLVKRFPAGAFVERSKKVGLTSEKLTEIVEQRLKIEKYLDFRFRNFVVVTENEIADYYAQVFVPRFRARFPGRVLPGLSDVRANIERRLTEAKIESDTDAFLDSARERAEIIMLNPV